MADLESPPSNNVPIMYFPEDLENTFHFVKFSSFEYSRDSRGTRPEIRKYTGHVFLPLPANLVANYSADWGQADLAGAGTGASGAIRSYAPSIIGKLGNTPMDKIGSTVEGLFGKLKTGAKNIEIPENLSKSSIVDMLKAGSNVPGWGGHVAGIAGAWALDYIDSVLGAPVASVGLGISKNPHIAVYYTAPQLRTHTFAYKLSARSKQESQMIDDIETFFKLGQHPEFLDGSSNHLLNYPDEFTIVFNNQSRLFKIMPSVLREFSINYHAQGMPAYFRETKFPVDVDISMTFQEVNILTKREIRQGY